MQQNFVLLPCNQARSLQGLQGHLHKQSCTSHPNATSSAQGQQDLPIKEDVQRYCAAHSKEELAELLVQVAYRCPQIWGSVL